MANGKRTSVVLDMIQHQMDKDKEDRDMIDETALEIKLVMAVWQMVSVPQWY